MLGKLLQYCAGILAMLLIGTPAIGQNNLDGPKTLEEWRSNWKRVQGYWKLVDKTVIKEGSRDPNSYKVIDAGGAIEIGQLYSKRPYDHSSLAPCRYFEKQGRDVGYCHIATLGDMLIISFIELVEVVAPGEPARSYRRHNGDWVMSLQLTNPNLVGTMPINLGGEASVRLAKQ